MRHRLAVLALSAACLLLLCAVFAPPGLAVDPKVIATCPVGGNMAVAGDYAYFAARNQGLRVVNVADPAAPYEVGSLVLWDSFAVDVVGRYAYVADGWIGLQIVDVSDPAAPVKLGLCDLGESATNVVVVGHYAYVAGVWPGPDSTVWSGFRVIDVSDPGAPFIAGNCVLPGPVGGTAAAGSHLYAAILYSGLQVIDISTPTSPSLAGSCPLYYSEGLAVAGDYVYASDLGGEATLMVIDVSDAANPVPVGTVPGPGEGGAVAVTGDHAYLTTYYQGLRAVDVTDPAAPFVDGSCPVQDAGALEVVGKYAYVCGSQGLYIIDLDPAQLDGVTPDHGQVGTQVTISGSSLGASGEVRFGATVATTSVWTDSAITCTVPEGVRTGATSVTVTPTGGATSNESAFAIEGAQVASLSPDHGVPRATVVINGIGLGVLGTVRFGSVEAATTVWTDTAITCTVPDGLAEGPTSVTVTPAGGATSNELSFMVDSMTPAVTVTASPRKVGYKGLVTLKGELRDSFGALLPGRTMVLQTSTDQNTWKAYKSVTSASGSFVATKRIVRKTYFRWSFAGDGVYVAVVSASSSANSKAKLTPLAVPAQVRQGAVYKSVGYLRPQHDRARALIGFAFYHYAGGKWQLATGNEGSRWKNVTGATKYWAYYWLGVKGKWRTRSMHLDGDHLKTYSPWRYFTVI